METKDEWDAWTAEIEEETTKFRIVVYEDNVGYVTFRDVDRLVSEAESVEEVEAIIRANFPRVRRAELAAGPCDENHVARVRATDARGRYSVCIHTV